MQKDLILISTCRFVFFVLRFNVPVNNFSVMSGQRVELSKFSHDFYSNIEQYSHKMVRICIQQNSPQMSLNLHPISFPRTAEYQQFLFLWKFPFHLDKTSLTKHFHGLASVRGAIDKFAEFSSH